MGREIRPAWRSALYVIAIAAALAFPLQASGTHNGGWWWHWGYNNMGGTVNPFVESGWNYWDDQFTDINSRAGGGSSATGMRFIEWGGEFCGMTMPGTGEFYHTTSDCSNYGLFIGQYIKNRVEHLWGHTAYLYTDSMNTG